MTVKKGGPAVMVSDTAIFRLINKYELAHKRFTLLASAENECGMTAKAAQYTAMAGSAQAFIADLRDLVDPK